MRKGVHTFILAVAVLELIALATGAIQSSFRIALNTPQLGTTHLILGFVALLAVLGLSLWGGAGRTALWLTCASLVLSAAIGWIAPGSPGRVVWHAIFSHLAVGLITAAAVLTSASWSQQAKAIGGKQSKGLRAAAQWTPPVVILQIAMGALYRHQIVGVMLHMLGAMVVAILALVVSVNLIQQFGEQPQLKSAASALMTVVLAQVCLGIAAFLMLLLGTSNTIIFVWLTTGHVCVGSLTFATSVIVAMQARRCLVLTNLP